MKKVGEVLKGRRERLGMTLHELESRTEIKRQILQAIEANDFSRLNNSNYAEGLITKYANAVNMDAKQLINTHREEIPNYDNSIHQSISAFQQHASPTYRSHSKESWQLLTFTSAIVIITALLWFIAVILF